MKAGVKTAMKCEEWRAARCARHMQCTHGGRACPALKPASWQGQVTVCWQVRLREQTPSYGSFKLLCKQMSELFIVNSFSVQAMCVFLALLKKKLNPNNTLKNVGFSKLGDFAL